MAPRTGSGGGPCPAPTGRVQPTQFSPEQREWIMTNRGSPPVLPQAPVDLMAVILDGRQVILAWTECGTGGLGFRIERADGIGSGCLFSKIGGVGPHVAAFCDESVRPRTTY